MPGLPFLDQKKSVSAIMSRRGNKAPVELANETQAPGSEDMAPGLMAAAEDLLAAVDSRSAIGVAKAMKAAYDVLDSAPGDDAADIQPTAEPGSI